ncbi:hypothetical protein [Caldilinea sp.]|uniref:hypothetical protein n=1 Tax=Caldilinea sp. TaxID=2293560 RepID=UPI002CEA6BFC|nr:hypothetical protein [Anaerolineales bacterium]HQY93277.1 hypothetical protein [Caldilinea sp.]
MKAKLPLPTQELTNGAALSARSGVALAFGELLPASAPLPEGETPTRPEAEGATPHRQSQEQLVLLTRFRQMRDGLANAADAFRLAMPSYGLTPAFLATGDSFYTAASDSIDARSTALVAAIEATAQQDRDHHLARTSYAAFRRVARTVVPAGPGRIALGLDELPPHRMDALVESAERILTRAQTEPYAALLASATYDVERLTETLAAVRALAASITAREVAARDAKHATEARNAAFDNLRTFINQVRVLVSAMLRLNPHLRAPIGFTDR